jgi:hypothetical protein
MTAASSTLVRHDAAAVLPELMQRLFDWSGDNCFVAVLLLGQAQIDIEVSLNGSNREVKRWLIASIEGHGLARGSECAPTETSALPLRETASTGAER